MGEMANARLPKASIVSFPSVKDLLVQQSHLEWSAPPHLHLQFCNSRHKNSHVGAASATIGRGVAKAISMEALSVVNFTHDAWTMPSCVVSITSIRQYVPQEIKHCPWHTPRGSIGGVCGIAPTNITIGSSNRLAIVLVAGDQAKDKDWPQVLIRGEWVAVPKGSPNTPLGN